MLTSQKPIANAASTSFISFTLKSLLVSPDLQLVRLTVTSMLYSVVNSKPCNDSPKYPSRIDDSDDLVLITAVVAVDVVVVVGVTAVVALVVVDVDVVMRSGVVVVVVVVVVEAAVVVAGSTDPKSSIVNTSGNKVPVVLATQVAL